MKILLVCGRAGLISAMKKLMKIKENSSLHCFMDCKSASELIFLEKIDLLIIDLMFNGAGIEFIGKAKKIQPEIKVIGISNSGLHRNYCLRIGCDGFLKSKFNFHDFKKELKGIFPDQFNFEE